ncbi:MAG TPA: hypothetical protein VKU81_05300 [Casimicrobiaceae bacterium]|nr:hypothetical protein [Casimicrobiaceae bacterium]
MDLRDQSPVSSAASDRDAGGGRRFAWHALAVLLAAVVAWLILAAYRQPDFILDFAGMRLC